jgi:hypothetical protein
MHRFSKYHEKIQRFGEVDRLYTRNFSKASNPDTRHRLVLLQEVVQRNRQAIPSSISTVLLKLHTLLNF